MPLKLMRGRYGVRFADGDADVKAAQRLRHKVFIADRQLDGGKMVATNALDADSFDENCDHCLIEERKSGELVCCFRMMTLKSGAEIERSYSAQYYELSALQEIEGPIVEMGRFCIHPQNRNADVLRIAWAAMTKYVDDRGVELLFGCSSFEGNDGQSYADAFTLLQERHLAPKRWLPRPKAPKIFNFGTLFKLRCPNTAKAMRMMPPLLRGYLSLGGWVSDHAVIDSDLNTLHVFTGLEIKRVPRSRARLLRQA